MDTSVIKVVSLSVCKNYACEILKGFHLLVTISEVEVFSSRAVAISYAWGEFNRRRILIGHDANGKIHSMKLGEEWDFYEFLCKLVSICADNGRLQGSDDHALCWIDQLCIPQQNSTDFFFALDRIPSIYKTLRVIALMPSGICGCLQNIWDSGGTKDVASGCINAVGVCSYTDRVWPIQELLYSRSISLERTSTNTIPCVESLEDIQYLGSYASILFSELKKQGHSDEEAFCEVGNRALRFQSKLGLTLFDYTLLHQHQNAGRSQEKLEVTMVGFLLGKTLTMASLKKPLTAPLHEKTILDDTCLCK